MPILGASWPEEGRMDERDDLVDQLCAIAGTIFEDVSAEAVSTSKGTEERARKIELIRCAAADARKLADAALIVLQRPAD